MAFKTPTPPSYVFFVVTEIHRHSRMNILCALSVVASHAGSPGAAAGFKALKKLRPLLSDFHSRPGSRYREIGSHLGLFLDQPLADLESVADDVDKILELEEITGALRGKVLAWEINDAIEKLLRTEMARKLGQLFIAPEVDATLTRRYVRASSM